MCYHVSTAKEDKFREFITEYDIVNYAFYFYTNGFDHQYLPVTTNKAPKVIDRAVWGLVNNDTADPSVAKQQADEGLNARDDRIFVSKFSPYTGNRCLVWVDGFYEWQHVEYKTQGKGARMRTLKEKWPYHINMPEHIPFTMGGIYSEWVNPVTGEILNTLALITTDANELLSEIHNTKKRMPLIIQEQDREKWLSDLPKDEMKALMKPLPDGILQAHTISKLITNRTDNPNQPAVQKPYIYSTGNTLF